MRNSPISSKLRLSESSPSLGRSQFEEKLPEILLSYFLLLHSIDFLIGVKRFFL